MRWIELEHPRRDRVTPDFRLMSSDGSAVTRTQHRQKQHLVLIFVPDPVRSDVQRTLASIARQRDSLRRAPARAYVISAREAPGVAPFPLLADPGDTVRHDYAALFPADERPGDDETFIVIADRYGAPQYGGLAPVDPDAVGDEVEERIWAIAYDCPE